MADTVHVIAEAGTNHGGALETARRLVDVAVEARADSVKFQIIYPEGLYVSADDIGAILTHPAHCPAGGSNQTNIKVLQS